MIFFFNLLRFLLSLIPRTFAGVTLTSGLILVLSMRAFTIVHTSDTHTDTYLYINALIIHRFLFVISLPTASALEAISHKHTQKLRASMNRT